jgi:hypothetical protein
MPTDYAESPRKKLLQEIDDAIARIDERQDVGADSPALQQDPLFGPAASDTDVPRDPPA